MLFAERIDALALKKCSEGAESYIAEHSQASSWVLDHLTPAEKKQVQDAVDDWSTNGPPQDNKPK